VLVLSADPFNKASGLLLVAPITQGGTASRENGFSVTLLGAGTKTHGIVLCDQTRTVDVPIPTHTRCAFWSTVTGKDNPFDWTGL